MTTHSSLFQKIQATQVSLASPPGTVMHAVAMGDRALEVMTDFKQRIPITVNGDFAISQALGIMMHSGVRLLFVLDASSRLMGLISSYDIQSEKPLRYLQSIGCTHKTCRHDDVRVSDIMEPIDNWQSFSFADVCRATVGDIVSTFKSTGRRHLVVMEPVDAPTKYEVRGLFSATQVGKQLGMAIELGGKVSTFAELEEALNGNHPPM